MIIKNLFILLTRYVCIVCLAWATMCCSSVDAADSPTLDLLYPQVGQQGTSVDVTVEGVFLDDLQQVLFYKPGIRCTKMVPIDEVFQHNDGRNRAADPGTAAKLTFEIDDDAEIGEYHLRIRTRDNLSEMVTFFVSPFPVVDELHRWADRDDKRNDSAATAQNIRLNTTVTGYLPGSLPQDHDWYSVDCKKGQLLSVEAVAARLGTLHYGGLNDPALRIYDSAGKELARDDDNSFSAQDPVVSIVIPADGRYFIDMHQQMDFEASRLRHYLLHVGTFSRPKLVFPLGGQAGKKIPAVILGLARGQARTTLSLPTKTGLYEKTLFDVLYASEDHLDDLLPVTPNRIHISDFPDVIERRSKKTVDDPQVISQSLPLAINGLIKTEGEVDWFRFTAKKGQRYRVRTYAKTVDSELDARIWIRPAKGTKSKIDISEDDSLWDHHDLEGHHYRHQVKQRLDPIVMFQADVDGDYLIGIGDTRREFSDHHLYRIEFQPHVDSAFAFLPAYPSRPKIMRDRIVLFPGHSFSRPIAIQPGFGSQYKGLLRLVPKNLPAGVRFQCDPFLQSAGSVNAEFQADDSAKVGAWAIDLDVQPVDEADRGSFRGGFIQNNQATNRRGDYAMNFRLTRKLAIAVVDGAKFNLSVQQPKIPLVLNGEMSLDVTVDRHEGFEGAVYCEADWLPSGINKQPPLIIPAGETTGTYKLSAGGSAVPGEYRVSITARENEGGVVRSGAGMHYVSSPLVTLSVGEPFVSVKLLRAAIERGKKGTMEAEIEHHRPFDATAKLMLGRLPFGVKQIKPYPEIRSTDEKAVFHLEVTTDCLVGQYRDIFAEVAIKAGDQVIRQQTGSGLLRVDAERK